MQIKLRRLLPLLLSMTVATSLIGCSTKPPEQLQFVPDKIEQVKPARPAPLVLYNEHFKLCGQSLCITPTEAKRVLQNKLEVYNWMRQANALFCYYEVREGKQVCSYSGAAASQ